VRKIIKIAEVVQAKDNSCATDEETGDRGSQTSSGTDHSMDVYKQRPLRGLPFGIGISITHEKG